ncbi:MAG: PqqD family protein [Magnetospirillum sp.]|nr:PqqD family protein [Magnetospirillum sp.]
MPNAPISESSTSSRNPALIATEVDGEVVMMHLDLGRYFGLDSIATDIWKRLETPMTFAALIDGLQADYEAERAVIAADVARLLAEMADKGLVALG